MTDVQLGHWILTEDLQIEQVDLMTWARWFEAQRERGEHDRSIIKRTVFPNGVLVSTVFVGLDHNFNDEGPMLLFETMIFRRQHGEGLEAHALQHETWDYQERYSTVAEALAGHERARQHVREVLSLDAMLEDPAP